MMRCFDCEAIVVTPDPPATGSVKGLTSQVRSVEVTCGRCGSRYILTIAKRPGKAKIERRASGDRRKVD